MQTSPSDTNGDEPATDRREPEHYDRQRRYRRRAIRSVSVMPTLCTLGNLVAGFAAIHYASMPPEFTGPWGWSGLTFAGALVFLGMFLDAIDGSLARLTRSISEVGGQLDSLADMVTFGLVPAYMTLRLVGQYLNEASGVTVIGPEADDALAKVIWAVAVVFVCCAALRLARFNVEAGPAGIERSGSFRGLPSPGAAGAVVSLIILHQHLLAKFAEDVPMSYVRGTALGIPGVALLCALAMVSSIAYPHFTNRFVYGTRSFGYMVRIVVPLALAVWWLQETLAVIFTLYALSGPVTTVLARRRTPSASSEG